MPKSIEFFAKSVFCACLGGLFFQVATAQGQDKSKLAAKTADQTVVVPKVTRIDIEALKKLLKPSGKPLMINFWATWCDPCREEFPDLVKIDAAYRGKIDFITISLDELSEINRDVPKFLTENKAQMPAYLLKTPDEDAAIALVTSEWNGNLPLTILFKETGETAYLRKGKIRPEDVTAEIDKLLTPAKTDLFDKQVVDLALRRVSSLKRTFEQGVVDAKQDIAVGNYRILRYGLTAAIPSEHLDKLRKKYSITVEESGCVIGPGYDQFVWGYNSTTKGALQRKFGLAVLSDISFATTGGPDNHR